MTASNEINLLHRHISLLKIQLKECRNENKKLRKEVARMNKAEASTSWAEDDRRNN